MVLRKNYANKLKAMTCALGDLVTGTSERNQSQPVPPPKQCFLQCFQHFRAELQKVGFVAFRAFMQRAVGLGSTWLFAAIVILFGWKYWEQHLLVGVITDE